MLIVQVSQEQYITTVAEVLGLYIPRGAQTSASVCASRMSMTAYRTVP